MKPEKYKQILEFVYMGGGFIPENEAAHDFTDRCVKGEIVPMLEVTQRDVKFHRAYFAFLSLVWNYLPKSFQNKIPEEQFYQFVNHLQGGYDIIFKFQDGTMMVKYKSISFGNMSQKRFEEYVAEQMPFIYSEILGKYFQGEIYDNIIETIEQDFANFLRRL